MTSTPELKRIYRALNAKYFNCELPDVDVYYEPCANKDAMVTRQVHPACDGEPAELEIVVDPSMKLFPTTLQLRMAHEQCHVKLWSERGLADHGQRFDAEIKRLCGYRSYRKLL